jgi:transposase
LRKQFAISDLGFSSFFNLIPPDSYAIIEASTNSFAFADKISRHFLQVFVANPFQLKLISMVKQKTDKIDAMKLAMYLKMQMVSGEYLIKPVYIPEVGIRELRSLFATHLLLKKQRAQIKNRIHSLFKQNLFPFTKEYIFGKRRMQNILSIEMPENLSFQVRLLLANCNFIEKQIKDIELKIIKSSEPFKKQVMILTSMKGISLITAIAIIADIADIKRFDSAKKLSSYLRSTPGIDSSNSIVRNLSTNKKGRKLSLTLISQPLNHFRDSNQKLNNWYQYHEKYKPKGKIRMALARKVICEIYYMLKREQYHYYRDEDNHNKKMKEYNQVFSAQIA